MRIGFIIGNLNDDYCNKISKFVSQKISSLKAHVVICECADIKSDTPIDCVYNTLYRYAACDCLDGIIIAPSTFLYQNIGELVKKLAKKISKPIVSMGLPIEGIHSVIIDYTAAFDDIISHFISHDINSFAFVSDPFSTPVFNLRYQAFLNAIRKNGLEIPSELILEGTGGYMSGYNCARKLAPLIRKGSVKAVICASDDIALSVIRYFSENNINVPCDVKIIGLDNTSNDSFYIPYLTTIDICLEQAFEKAVSVLYEQIFGNNQTLTHYYKPELIIGLSCGCDKNDQIKNDFRIPWTCFHGLKAIPQASEGEDIIPKLTQYLALNNVSHCFIVKYCNPIRAEISADEAEKYMGTLFFGFSKGKCVTLAKSFSTLDILPSHIMNKISEPMLIKPIFISNITFGFLFISVSMHMAPLINDLGNELSLYFSSKYFNEEFMELEKKNNEARESLMISNKRLNELTVKENLDKLENVRQLASNMLQKRKGITGEYILIVVEIVNYQNINEQYGFSEGEYVISCVSNILANSIRDDDFLSHQSFERYVLLVKNIQQNPIQTISKRFLDALEELNQSNDKPYKISVCWGSATANMESNIEEAYSLAEENLLDAKQKRLLNL